MYGHGVIQIAFGRTHAYRHGKSLQHFVRPFPEGMNPDDPLFGTDRDQLYRREPTLRRQGIGQGSKAVGVAFDPGPEAFPGLRFGEPDGTDRRVAENHGGNELVVEVAFGHPSEQAVGKPAARRDGDRRQLMPAAGYVADGMDVLEIGRLVTVDRHRVPGIELHPGGFQFQPGRIRHATDGTEYGIITADLARIGPHDELVVLAT